MRDIASLLRSSPAVTGHLLVERTSRQLKKSGGGFTAESNAERPMRYGWRVLTTLAEGAAHELARRLSTIVCGVS